MGTRKIEVQIVGDASSLQRAFGRAGASGSAWGKTMDRAGRFVKNGLMAAGVGVTAGIGYAVKSAADFQQQMATVAAVSGASRNELSKMQTAALKFGASTQYSAKQVASAEGELAKAGLTAQQILQGGLKSALTLAAAGQINLADAASYTANAMNAFGMKAADTGQIASAFAVAANVTTADVGDFGMALTQAASSAHAANMSFNQTMVGLTALAKMGVKGSDAGTSLKTTLTQIAKPTSQAKKEMDRLGLSFFDAHGKMRDLSAVSADLRDKWGGLTAKQRLASAATIAGTDGQRTLLALYAAGPKALTEYARKLRDQTAAQKMVDKQNATAGVAFKQLKNSIEVVGIMVGAVLLPPLARAAKAVSAFMISLTTGSGFASFREGLAGVASALGSMFGFIGAHAHAFTTLAAAVGGFFAVVLPGLAIYRTFIALQAALNALMLMNPFGVVVLALAGLTAAFIVAYRESSTFRSVVSAVWNAVKTVVLAYANAYVAVFNTIKSVTTGIIGAAKAVGAGVVSGFNKTREAAAVVAGAVASAIGAVRSAVGAAASAASAVGAAFVRGVAVVAGIVGVVAGKVAAAIGAVGAAAAAAYSAAMRIGSQIVSGVLNGLGSLYSALKSKVESTIGSVLSHINIPGFSPVDHAAMEAIGIPLVDGAVAGVAMGKDRLGKAISSAVRQAVLDAKGNLNQLGGSLGGAVGSFIDAKSASELSALNGSPEAMALKQLQDARAADQTSRQRAQLEADKAAARTMKDREAAAQALADFERDQQIQAAQDALDAQRQAIADAAEARKKGFDQGVADLTNALNTGAIGEADFQAKLLALLNDQAPGYAQAGQLLGTAFAQQFQEQLAAVLAQAREIGVGPQATGSGMAPGVNSPSAVATSEWREAQAKLDKAVAEAKKAVASASANLASAKAAVASGGKPTESELLRLRRAETAAAGAKAALTKATNAANAHKRTPKFGAGGIAWGPTHALIGERNAPEAVIPLTRDGVAAFTKGLGLAGAGVNIGQVVVRNDTDVAVLVAGISRRMAMGA